MIRYLPYDSGVTTELRVSSFPRSLPPHVVGGGGNPVAFVERHWVPAYAGTTEIAWQPSSASEIPK